MPRPEVFLSHASADKESVKAIARQLSLQAIPTWLDEWNLIPGEPWVDAVGQALKECSGCIVFLGPGGDAPWHHEEVRAALNHAVRDRSYRVIPVLLPGTRQERLSHIPEFLASRQWVTFPSLDDAGALHRLVCGIQGREPGAPAGAPNAPGSNPYRGLRVFDVGDAPLFFGREVLTQELLAKLTPESRFVSIVGPSGSGKSSLARAGLLASLRASGLPGSAEWPQIIVRPGAFPLESLAVGLAGRLAPQVDPSELIRRLGSAEEALHREVRMALQGRPELRAVLLVDQAEEAFTLSTREAGRAAFFANLLYAATARAGQTVVVLAFRADFFPRFAEHRPLAALVSESLLLVPPMSEDELRRAIALPAARSGRSLRPALVDELLDEVNGRPGSLPLLEHALAQLWERPEPVLGIEEYRSIGGVSGALNSRAEEVFGALAPSQQATCRRLFLRLIQHGEESLDTRRRVRGTELPGDQREVSQAFAAEGIHLLTWSREGEHEFLEVAHEELIRRWGRLQQWGHEDRLGQRIHRRLTAAVEEWNGRAPATRDESFLYRGTALAEVEEWLARLPGDERSSLLNPDELAFLEHSRAARDRTRLEQERRLREAEELAEKREALRVTEQQRRRESEASEHRVRNRFAVAVAMACLAAGAAAVALRYANKAKREQAVALSRELTAVVGASLEGDPQLNLALLKEAHEQAETEELFPVLAQWANALGHAELRGHSNWVWSAAFSPDGLRVVTASRDNTARLWDAASGKPLATLSGHTGSVYGAAFSPDGLRVVTASDDKTARLWDAATGKPLATLSGHSSLVRSAVFSRDGLRIVTASEDHTARIWNAATGKPLATLSGHSGSVYSAAFSPDGLRVVTASHDNTARLWDAATGKPLATLSGHSDSVWSAAFSPDGHRVVTASEDRTVQLWDAATGKPLATLSGHSSLVRSAAFSRDGLRIVTASEDRTARLWDAVSGKPLATLSGHSGPVRSAAFSPDGLRVVTAGDDHTARLWDAATGKPLATLSGHSGPVRSAAFSPDGHHVVTAGDDNMARLWNAASGKPLAILSGHSGSVYGAAFSPDGHHVVTAGDDHTARLWDAASGKPLATLSGHSGPVRSAAFSPDGLRVVTAGEDHTARLWDAASGEPLATLSGHSSVVWSAAFSPDGLRIVTASRDDTVRLWDAASGQPLATFSGYSHPVLGAAFNPDGLHAITTSDDHAVQLWDAASGRLLAALSGHTGSVWSAAFSPDGLHVVTASDDKTARLWDAASGKPLATFSGHSDSVRSAAFSPDGLRVLTTSDDRTARLWDAVSGKLLAALSGHSGWVRSAAFSPDGLRVVTASSDHTALVWQDLLWAPRSNQLQVLASGRKLTPDERHTYLHE